MFYKTVRNLWNAVKTSRTLSTMSLRRALGYNPPREPGGSQAPQRSWSISSFGLLSYQRTIELTDTGREDYTVVGGPARMGKRQRIVS